MKDISIICEDIFKRLSEIHNVRQLDNTAQKRLNFTKYYQVWSVESEISVAQKCISIELYICFTEHFPTEFPRIYISSVFYEQFKYLPHIDENLFVCIFDSNLSRPDIKDPYGVVIASLEKAKLIIENGINIDSTEEFLSEYNSYWLERYNNEPPIDIRVLSLIDGKPNNNVGFIVLKQDIQGYRYVIHQNDKLKDGLLDYLKISNISFEEIDSFYFELNEEQYVKPPFDTSNAKIIDILGKKDDDVFQKFKKYINSKTHPKVLLFYNNVADVLLGAFVGMINTSRSGYRPNQLSRYTAFSTFHKNDRLTRIHPTIFTLKRLHNRSAGEDALLSHPKFCIAGLGSIGSNLAYFLNSLSFPEFRFIDPDLLFVENIGRHLLGMEYVNMNKATAVAKFFKTNNPIQVIHSKEESILDICTSDLSFLNESDYMFICIGAKNIDLHLVSLIEEKKIVKPAFFIWVEPFLAGGHCLYINPQDNTYPKYFEDDLFRFNIIDNEEYKVNIGRFTKQEMGCRTTYTPYASSNITLFLSSLFPAIVTIIQNNQLESTSFSWAGNIDHCRGQNIRLSEHSKSFNDKSILIETRL